MRRQVLGISTYFALAGFFALIGSEYVNDKVVWYFTEVNQGPVSDVVCLHGVVHALLRGFRFEDVKALSIPLGSHHSLARARHKAVVRTKDVGDAVSAVTTDDVVDKRVTLHLCHHPLPSHWVELADALIVLPRTQRDDINLYWEKLSVEGTTKALIDDFEMAFRSGSLAWLSVHSQNFNEDGILDVFVGGRVVPGQYPTSPGVTGKNTKPQLDLKSILTKKRLRTV